jgi:cytochrome c oxidase cbb3-type subunit 3
MSHDHQNQNQNQNQSQLDVKADEKHILIDHSYDGIQELNHPLPSWWNVMFWGAIMYSTGYFAYYQFMGGPSLREEFKRDYAVIEKAQEEFKKANQKFNPELYSAVANPEGIKKGKEVYEMNCMPCHSEEGRGDVGPNLTDKHWVKARGTPETVYNVVFNGSEENGMPVWGETLPKEEIYLAVSYVMSLKHTFKKGKAPQGILVEN